MEREAFVAQGSVSDPDLVAELRRFISEHELADSLLARRPVVAPAMWEPESPRFPPGHVLTQRFRIASFIAGGGMGEVNEAEDLELGGRVALKCIRPTSVVSWLAAPSA